MTVYAQTQRLTLREFASVDAKRLSRLADTPSVACMVMQIPHPYPPEVAEGWIALSRLTARRGGHQPLAIEHRSNGVIGACGFTPLGDEVFEIGYWVGEPYWGHGFATEAGEALIRYLTEDRGAREIRAGYFVDNPASARVLEKLGFVSTGKMAQTYCLAREEQVNVVGMALNPALALPMAAE